MLRSQEGWKAEYRGRGALWIHDEDPLRPHALLTSGNHSTGFFNSEGVLEDPALVDGAALDLTELLEFAGLDLTKVNRVVGPAMGAITLAHDIARHISYKSPEGCLRAYVEKHEDVDGVRSMRFGRTKLRAGEHVLLAEDVMTTGGSIALTADAVLKAGGIVLPYVVVLVNRSGHSHIDGREIVSLITHPMPVYTPDECPLCAAGSEPLRPKDSENWQRLNAVY